MDWLSPRLRPLIAFLPALLLTLSAAVPTSADVPALLDTYNQLKGFRLGEQAVRVEDFKLKRDRIEMIFTGTFYFAEPIGGKVYGAVFLGNGQLWSEPWNLFEKENVKRFLKKETVEASFSKAVFRFTDDTHALLAVNTPLPAGSRSSGGAEADHGAGKTLGA